MPKFSRQEKELIQKKLEAEGERLFTSLGLKKVTIDNLVGAVGIAKASFYSFYVSKEYLYMDIVQNIQRRIFAEAESILGQSQGLHSKERVRRVFHGMSQSMMSYPVLQQINTQTIEYLERKVSKERLADFQKHNIDAAHIMSDHGIKFTCDVEIASLAFQALYFCWISLQNQSAETQKQIVEIMLDGVIERIVAG